MCIDLFVLLLLKGSLQPYHLEGLNFLRSAWSNRTHVVLADNMWLGNVFSNIILTLVGGIYFRLVLRPDVRSRGI